MKAKILIADDEKEIRDIVKMLLEGEGYEEMAAADGQEALSLADASVDLYILDVNMPKLSGFGAAAEIRKHYYAPILFLTAYSGESDKVMGFSVGGDDYLVKPFDPDELILRVGALLRRARIAGSHRLETGNLVMDEEEHTAYLNGRELPLTVREFDILFRLLSYPKKTFTRSQLMEAFWDYDSSATSRTVDVYMAKLREKTAGCDGFDIVTVHGLGYKAVLR